MAHLAQLAPPALEQDGTWTLSVQLDPPQLGRVDAVVSFGAAGLGVLLVPSAPVAQQVLQQASQHIAANLGATVTVSTGSAPTGTGSEGNAGHQQASAHNPGRADLDDKAAESNPTPLRPPVSDGTYIFA